LPPTQAQNTGLRTPHWLELLLRRTAADVDGRGVTLPDVVAVEVVEADVFAVFN